MIKTEKIILYIKKTKKNTPLQIQKARGSKITNSI